MSILLIFSGCEPWNRNSTTSTFDVEKGAEIIETLDSIPNHWLDPGDFVFDHCINIGSREGFLPVRTQMNLDNNEIIAYLYNGTSCNLSNHSNGFFKIRFKYKNALMEGFLIDSYNGKPTVVPIGKEKWDVMKYASNYIVNPALLPFCRVLLNTRFDELLQKRFDDLEEQHNSVQDKEIFFHDFLCKLFSDDPEYSKGPLFFAIIVGESQRVPFIYGDLVSSDIGREHVAVQNFYYFMKSIYHCEVNSYYPPKRVDNFAIRGDTLVGDFEGVVMLYPEKPKFAFSNDCRATWILVESSQSTPTMGKSKYRDITYLLQNERIAHEQISHDHLMVLLQKYFYECIENKLL